MMSFDLLLNYIVISWLNLFPLVVNLVLSLVVLFIGLLLAGWLGRTITFVGKLVMLDKLASMLGLDSMLERANIRKSVSELLGGLIYWLIVLVVVSSLLSVFGIRVEAALLRLFAYMGIVFVSALILGLGLFLAIVLSGIVKLVLVALGLEEARVIARVIYYTVVVFAFLAALAELGFTPKDLAPHLGIIIGFPALAAAIAFGLGCKDMAADFFHNLFKGR